MRLLTKEGQLDLPKDFSLTMERTNPLLSGEGDATIPATLPSSSRNLAALGHRERIDRANRYTNKVDAILQVGPVQKRGQLVIDTMHRREGIDASFAIDNSDLYVSGKGKTLKALLEAADKKETFGRVEAVVDIMQDVYEGDDTRDYIVFPVAIAPYDDNGTDTYQFNNEVNIISLNAHELVYNARYVHEGDIQMAVPVGYGIAPFLKLHRLLACLFEAMGYTVAYNCFAENYPNIAVVHNCSDCLCNPTATLYYKDMAPSCTLSEFLDWLLAKFHAQPVVDSEAKTVRIVIMEDMLAETPDDDVTDRIEGDWKVQLNPKKRIVLTPTNDLEGTAPATDTFDKLMDKYGSFVAVDEAEFRNLTVADCLILRKATGQFYALKRDAATGETVKALLGTNHFTYDRDNSDETEDFSQDDSMPLMLCGTKSGSFDVVPFIGERLNAHTAYEDKEESTDQKIIVVQYKNDADNLHYWTTGTTQRHIPTKDGHSELTLPFGLTNYEMYGTFWQRYNDLLLNHATHVSARLRITVGAFIGMDMSRPQLCDGQPLLPVNASAQLSDKMGMAEAEFVINKAFDGDSDTPITPSAWNGLHWQLRFTDDDTLVELTWQQVVNDWETNNHIPTTGDNMTGYSVIITDATDPIYLGPPAYEGQVTHRERHDIEITVYGMVKYRDGDDEAEAGISDSYTYYNHLTWYEAVAP